MAIPLERLFFFITFVLSIFIENENTNIQDQIENENYTLFINENYTLFIYPIDLFHADKLHENHL